MNRTVQGLDIRSFLREGAACLFPKGQHTDIDRQTLYFRNTVSHEVAYLVTRRANAPVKMNLCSCTEKRGEGQKIRKSVTNKQQIRMEERRNF